MVKLADLDSGMRDFLIHMPCPKINVRSFNKPPALSLSRVALVSSAGLRLRDDAPFTEYAQDYRILPREQRANFIQAHMNASHDRTGFIQDLNTIFPLDRLEEMAADGEIGSVADYHYSFMGATHPTGLEPKARSLAKILIRDEVDVVLLCPV